MRYIIGNTRNIVREMRSVVSETHDPIFAIGDDIRKMRNIIFVFQPRPTWFRALFRAFTVFPGGGGRIIGIVKMVSNRRGLRLRPACRSKRLRWRDFDQGLSARAL